jgi:hypothetical protein
MGRISMLSVLIFLSPGLWTTVASAHSNYLPNGSMGTAFRGGKTFHFPNGLAITLLSYKPATGLTQLPGGPPLRPHNGYRFVSTTWVVRNTTNQTVTVASWVAKSRGMTSRGFITGNAGESALVGPRTKALYYWLFEVARVGKVAIFYGASRAHWLPRG